MLKYLRKHGGIIGVAAVAPKIQAFEGNHERVCYSEKTMKDFYFYILVNENEVK